MISIPSPNAGGTRGNVIWVIIHTAEGARNVRDLGSYFAKPSAQASSHVGIDDNEIAQYVPYDKAAWTALSANPYGDQAELCAFAAWDRSTWLSHSGMLENAAQWIAGRCTARGIPPVKIGPAEVAAHKPGVIGHIDVTLGLGGTHTDPGKAFPWDVVMARAAAIVGGSPATPIEKDWFDMATKEDLTAVLRSEGISGAGDAGAMLNRGYRRAIVDGVAAALRSEGVSGAADVGRLAAALAQTQQAAQVVAALPEDFARQLADELAKRLAA